MFKREFSFKKSVKFFLGIFLLTTISVLFYYITPILFAWTGPSEGPPGGNLDLVGIVRNRFSMVEANVSGNVEIDLSQGSVFKHTLTGNVTYTGITGYSTGKLNSFKLIVEQDSTEFYEITWPGSVNWRGHVVPSNPGLNTGAIYEFNTYDDGSNWYGFVFYLASAVFGPSPAFLSGVDFFDGTPEKGMIVFKTVGTYSIEPAEIGNVEVLVVAGGGGASRGGGGAGGYLYNGALIFPMESLTVKVGAGGAGGAPNSFGGDGGSSQFYTMTAVGGGGGADTNNATAGRTGGSGGGGGYNSGSGGVGTVGPPRQGYNGGIGYSVIAVPYCGGGGGGASAAGAVGNSVNGGKGGDGVNYFGFYYAGGGGGSWTIAPTGSPASGGLGGGGSAGDRGWNSPGIPGYPNTGGGGGGWHYQDAASMSGGSGGKGIVIVRWGGYSKNYNPTTNAVW